MLQTILPIITSLLIIEVLLSVDNALVNATIAEALPEKQRVRAIRIGIVLGAVFRVGALLAAAYIIQNEWIKILGGLYLVYLFVEHIGKEIDESNKVVKKAASYKRAIVEIAIADIVFSLDNVISAVSFSDNLAIVMLGVGIGVLSMLFITPLLSKLIHRFESLASAAYVIVGMIGLALIVETVWHIHVGELTKFAAIIGIILVTLLFDTNPRFKCFAKPIFNKATLVIGFPLDMIRLAKRIAHKR